MNKKEIVRRAALIDEMQTQARTENPHGASSARIVAIRTAASRTLVALPEGLSLRPIKKVTV